MSTLGERKSALLLLSLGASDQRRLLARLPAGSARTIRALMHDLRQSRLPVAELADALLGDEMRGLTARTSLDVDQLVALSTTLSPAWFARVLAVWTGVDRTFCLALLDHRVAAPVREELDRLGKLPPKLLDALRAESLQLVSEAMAAPAAPGRGAAARGGRA